MKLLRTFFVCGVTVYLSSLLTIRTLTCMNMIRWRFETLLWFVFGWPLKPHATVDLTARFPVEHSLSTNSSAKWGMFVL